MTFMVSTLSEDTHDKKETSMVGRNSPERRFVLFALPSESLGSDYLPLLSDIILNNCLSRILAASVYVDWSADEPAPKNVLRSRRQRRRDKLPVICMPALSTMPGATPRESHANDDLWRQRFKADGCSSALVPQVHSPMPRVHAIWIFPVAPRSPRSNYYYMNFSRNPFVGESRFHSGSSLKECRRGSFFETRKCHNTNSLIY